MLQEILEPAWADAFEQVLRRCALQRGDTVAILCETQSRPVLAQLARLAAARIGAQAFTLMLPSVTSLNTPTARSTGASNAIQQIAPVVAALAGSTLVVDCTVEGLMHAPELPAILKGGARVIYISNEHPEALARLLPDDATEALVKAHIKRLRGATAMRVTSAAGSDLTISLEGAAVGGNWGFTTRPGTMTHWPGGIALAFPAAGSVSGTLVLAEGDVNLTFKRYIERPIALTIERDYITDIAGTGVDAELMRSYIAAWDGRSAGPPQARPAPSGLSAAAPDVPAHIGTARRASASGAGTSSEVREATSVGATNDKAAYAVSHVGYGLCAAARWDSMALYDKRDFNGTELRAFAGNFLYSTGANEVAGRYTLGHFDLPMRNCTVQLDGVTVVDQGRLLS